MLEPMGGKEKNKIIFRVFDLGKCGYVSNSQIVNEEESHDC